MGIIGTIIEVIWFVLVSIFDAFLHLIFGSIFCFIFVPLFIVLALSIIVGIIGLILQFIGFILSLFDL